MALSNVDFPWKPPPTIVVMPEGIAMPVIGPSLGNIYVFSSEGGDRKGTTSGDRKGLSIVPECLGRIAPLGMKETIS
jgi:hypothetical protein